MRLAILAAAVALAMSAEANAEPLFGVFQRTCFASGADATSAERILEADGWTHAADTDGQQSGPQATWSRNIDGRQMILLVDKKLNAPPGMIPARACVLLARPADAEAAVTLGKWAAVPPLPKGPPIEGAAGIAYAFFDEAGVHRPAPTSNSPRDLALAKGKALYMVAAVTSADQSMLSLTAFDTGTR